MTKQETIILSLGGSLIVPDEIDVQFLQQFRRVVENLLPRYRFIIFTGGGKTARRYQQAGQSITKNLSNESKDWIGIKASLLNAELVKQIFGAKAVDTIITDPRVKLRWPRSIWIGAGWKPGRSTDYDAVRIAVENNIKTVINLSDIDYVYSQDPRKYPNAQPVKEFTWKAFRDLVGNRWDPGLNVPFDPIAAKLAQQKNITVKILNGRNLKNLRKAIQQQAFLGTTITNQS